MSEKIKKLSEIGHLILKNEEVLDGIEDATTYLSSEMHKKVLFVNNGNAHEVLNYARSVVNVVLSGDCTFLLSYMCPMNVWIIHPNKFDEAKAIFK